MFSYQYDLAGNVTKRTYPGNVVADYTYDVDNRLATAVSAGTTTYGYDAAGNLTSTTIPSGNGYIETRVYDRAGRLTEVLNKKGSTTLSRFVATLDAVGNPLQVVRTGSLSQTQTYTYDANDRLLSVCFQAGACPGAQDPFIRWTYDKVGNALTEQRPSGTTTSTYNNADQLLTAGATAFAYDQNGNETQKGSTAFTYDLANRLKTHVSGTTTSYTYDGDGKRLQASTGSQAGQKTNFLWDASFGLAQLAFERDGNNSLIRRYTYGIQRISQTAGASTSYFHYDRLGSVVNVTSASGATQWTRSYEPFGSIRTETQNGNPPASLMKFTGEYLDPTGLYHLRARQYDPVIARFLRLDPRSADRVQPYVSSYVYAKDRPTVLIDPSGLGAIASSDEAQGAANAVGWPVTEDSMQFTSKTCAVPATATAPRKPYAFFFANADKYVIPRLYVFSFLLSVNVRPTQCGRQFWDVSFLAVYDTTTLGFFNVGDVVVRAGFDVLWRDRSTGITKFWRPKQWYIELAVAERWPARATLPPARLNLGSGAWEPYLAGFGVSAERGEEAPFPRIYATRCPFRPNPIRVIDPSKRPPLPTCRKL